MEKVRKILIVDDEPKFRRQMKTFFTRRGFEVETAANGTSALESARNNPPNVLIIDWILKDTINGLEVVLQLKQDNPDLAAVLISGYPSPEMEQRAKEIGRLTFISKPFDAEEIMSAVQRAGAGDNA